MSFFKHDAKKEIWQWGLLGGLSQSLYILFVANFFQLMQKTFPQDLGPLLAPILMLTFFVFSVAVSGLLVLGRPTLLVVKKEYREAVLTLAVTLGVLFLMLVAVVLLAIT